MTEPTRTASQSKSSYNHMDDDDMKRNNTIVMNYLIFTFHETTITFLSRE